MSLLDKAVILPVPHNEVCNYREIALPFIQLALESSDQRYTAESILDDTNNRERQLWIVKDQHTEQYIAAVVTMIYTDNEGKKIGEISFAGGRDHEKWDHFVDSVGVWFKDLGCDFIDIIGRPGWQRLYRDRGFRLERVLMRRAIS